MKNLFVIALVGVLGLASVASAGHGDRQYGGHGGDSYSRQRYEASARYERGSHNYAQTYVRYGQESHSRLPSYDRDYAHRGGRGSFYDYGRSHRSNWGFSFGYGSSYGHAGDSVSLGLYYSNRPPVYYRYPSYGYYRPPGLYDYGVHPYVYNDHAPALHEYRENHSAPGYYHHGSDSGSYSHGYYSR